MHTIEIELRYEVHDPQQLTSFLAPFEKLHQKHDIDIYFDNPEALLYQKGIFIRTRNNKKLEIKFNRATLDDPTLAIQDYCEEHSFLLPLQEGDLERLNALLVSLNLKPTAVADLEHLLHVNNFAEHYAVDKVRTSYKHNDFTVCLDEVAGLGTFLEIELMASTTQNLSVIKASMLQLIDGLIGGLNISPLRTGYGTLLLRKNRFEHYLLGRFILEEDKIYRNGEHGADPDVQQNG